MSRSSKLQACKTLCTHFDWVHLGYWLYVIGSCLYFAQALNPFLNVYNIQDEQALAYNYYYYGPESRDDVNSWISIIAALIFIAESVFYVIGLHFERTYGNESVVLNAYYLDWLVQGVIL
jgi:uncharacterized membrane protein